VTENRKTPVTASQERPLVEQWQGQNPLSENWDELRDNKSIKWLHSPQVSVTAWVNLKGHAWAVWLRWWYHWVVSSIAACKGEKRCEQGRCTSSRSSRYFTYRSWYSFEIWKKTRHLPALNFPFAPLMKYLAIAFTSGLLGSNGAHSALRIVMSSMLSGKLFENVFQWPIIATNKYAFSCCEPIQNGTLSMASMTAW